MRGGFRPPAKLSSFEVRAEEDTGYLALRNTFTF
jgi:hypothetical protein